MEAPGALNVLAAFLYVKGLVPEDQAHAEIISHTQLVSACLQKLIQDLSEVTEDYTEEQIQSIFYEAGKLHFTQDLRYWFKVLYQVLLGQMDGPRLGQFTKIMTSDWIEHRVSQVMQDPWVPA